MKRFLVVGLLVVGFGFAATQEAEARHRCRGSGKVRAFLAKILPPYGAKWGLG